MVTNKIHFCTCIHTNPSVLEIICGSTNLSFDGSIVPDDALTVVCSIVDAMDFVAVDNDDDVDIWELRILPLIKCAYCCNNYSFV